MLLRAMPCPDCLCEETERTFIALDPFITKRYVIDDDADWPAATKTNYTGVAAGSLQSHAYDRTNEKLYQGAVDGSNGKIYRCDENDTGTSPTLVATTTGTAGIFALACDPANERLFYIGGGLRKINYDGTGDASVITWSNTSTSASGVDLWYDAASDRIYYIKAESNTVRSIRYVSPDGSGDTSIYTYGDLFGGAVQRHPGVVSLTGDGTNVFFAFQTSTAGDTQDKIYSIPKGGGTATAIYTLVDDSSKIAFVRWSPAESKLYFMHLSGTDDMLLGRMDDDGANQEDLVDEHVDLGDWPGNPCRFEVGRRF